MISHWTILKTCFFNITAAAAVILFISLGGVLYGQGGSTESPLIFSGVESLSTDISPEEIEKTSQMLISAFESWLSTSLQRDTGKRWVIDASLEAPKTLKEIQVSLLHITVNSKKYTAPVGPLELRQDHINDLFNSWIPELRDASAIPSFQIQSGRKYSIVIDPGHGGMDSGAVSSRKIMEKDLNRSLSLKCAEELRKSGFTVSFTTDPGQDNYLSLPGREKAVRAAGPDLVISLHHDSTSDKSVRGFSVFYGLYQPHEDRQAIKARVDKKDVNFVGELILDERTHLIYKTQKGQYGYATSRRNIWRVWDESPGSLAAQCRNIAEVVHGGLVESLNYTIPARGKAREADFFLLRRMGYPVILIEAGYVSNNNEVLTVQKEENQQIFAEALAATLRKYYYGNEGPVETTGK